VPPDDPFDKKPVFCEKDGLFYVRMKTSNTMRHHLKPILRWAISLFFIGVGISHFVDPTPFLTIMPPALPWQLELVYISGFFEILGGIGLLFRFSRRAAAWGLICLLIAVYPANIHMLVNEVYLEGMRQEKWLLWLRMPLQFVLAAGVLWTADIWPKPKINA